MPEEHIYRNWYEAHGLIQLHHFFREIKARHQEGTSRYGTAKIATINGINIVIDIDEFRETPGGYQAIYHRIGIKKSSRDMRLGIYRRILSEEKYQPLEIFTHSLSDNEMTLSSLGNDEKAMQDVEPCLDFIQRNHFPPEPKGNWTCANCPFLFICPI